jgi:hypothetical protein
MINRSVIAQELFDSYCQLCFFQTGPWLSRYHACVISYPFHVPFILLSTFRATQTCSYNEINIFNNILFFYWRYNPLWVLAFSVIFFHSALSLHNFLHHLISIICISFSMFSIHLSPWSYYHVHILVSYSKSLSWGRSSFRHWILRNILVCWGQSCQPCAQPPTWRTRVSLLVWSLY